MPAHKLTRKALNDLACTATGYSNCDIYLVRRIKSTMKMSENVNGVKQGTVRYEIVLAGPNPCCCDEETIKAAAWAWDPPEYSGHEDDAESDQAILCGGVERLPIVGEYLPLGSGLGSSTPDAVYAVKDVAFDFRSKECRFVSVVVSFDNRCLVNDSFYMPDGTRIDDIDDLPLAAARIEVRERDKSVPVESASYHGIYGRDGAKKFYTIEPNSNPDKRSYTDSTFPFDDQYCCRAARVMEEGNEYVPCNTAGIPFDPMQKDVGDFDYVIWKPYLAVNLCNLRNLKHKVNCDPFWLIEFTRGHVTLCDYIDTGTARLRGFELQNAEWCDGTPIKMVGVVMSIRTNKRTEITRDIVTGDITDVTEHEFGWDELIANKGYGEHLCVGDPDQHGGTFGNPDEGVIGHGSVQQIQDATGNLPEEPVFLNHVGHAINQEQLYSEQRPCSSGLDVNQLLYLRWRKYRRIKFLADETPSIGGLNIPAFVGTVIFDTPPAGAEAERCSCMDVNDVVNCPASEDADLPPSVDNEPT